MTRLTREDFFMEAARLCAKRSTCLRGQVGAVLVDGKHIVAHGYNGAPAGMNHCLDVGCDEETVYVKGERAFEPQTTGCRRAIHAEANLIAYAARHGVCTLGCVLYSTAEPCRKCAELIVQAGITHVYFENPYRLGASQFLTEAGIHIYQHVWTPVG
jgi:dCMP deaminase